MLLRKLVPLPLILSCPTFVPEGQAVAVPWFARPPEQTVSVLPATEQIRTSSAFEYHMAAPEFGARISRVGRSVKSSSVASVTLSVVAVVVVLDASVVPRPLKSVSPLNRYVTVPENGTFHDGGLSP